MNETNGLVTCGGGTSTRIDSCVSTTNGSTLSASACNVSSLTVVESCAGWPCLSSLPPTLTISLAGPCEFIGYSYPSTPSCAADVFGNTNFSTECIYVSCLCISVHSCCRHHPSPRSPPTPALHPSLIAQLCPCLLNAKPPHQLRCALLTHQQSYHQPLVPTVVLGLELV